MVEALLGIVTGVAVAAVIIALSLRSANLETRATNTDLLNRLASRTYGEYAAFNAQPAQGPLPDPGRRLYDETGLIEVDEPDYD